MSRSFSNPGRVNPATRERVQAAAAELGYEPRPLARAEAPGRTRTLMLVVPDISNPYYTTMIKAAQQRAIERNYTLTLTDSDESPQVEANNLRQVLASTSGGILATSRLSDEIVQRLGRHRPLVMLNREIAGIPSLVWDTTSGMRQATRHLAALGHRRIAYLSGPRNSWMNGYRWRAMHEEAMLLGMHPVFLGPFAPTLRSGREAADAITTEKATAVIAYNDLLAIGTLQRLQDRGVRLPRDLSLIGCDDIFGAELTVPALTTITGPTARLGTCAVDLVHSRITGRNTAPTAANFEAHLVIRGSTGPA